MCEELLTEDRPLVRPEVVLDCRPAPLEDLLDEPLVWLEVDAELFVLLLVLAGLVPLFGLAAFFDAELLVDAELFGVALFDTALLGDAELPVDVELLVAAALVGLLDAGFFGAVAWLAVLPAAAASEWVMEPVRLLSADPTDEPSELTAFPPVSALVTVPAAWAA